MSKSPAFQFYVRDWILSRTVSKMSGDAVKAYLYLLSESWLETPRSTLPENDEELAKMAQCSEKKWRFIKDEVMQNFIISDGRWVNEKLLNISRDQARFAQWGKLGGNPKLSTFEPKRVNPPLNPQVNPPLNPLVNLASSSATASSSASSNKRVVFVKPTHTQANEYAKSIGFELNGEYFIDYHETRDWKLKSGVPMKDWKAAIRTWKHIQKNGSNKDHKKTSTPPSSTQVINDLKS